MGTPRCFVAALLRMTGLGFSYNVIQALQIKEYQDFYFPGEYTSGQGSMNHILYIDAKQYLALLIHIFSWYETRKVIRERYIDFIINLNTGRMNR
jgi:hypothetical protein